MVHPPSNAEESLEIVARAMVLLRRPVDLREKLDLTETDDQDANVGGRRSDQAARPTRAEQGDAPYSASDGHS